MPETNEPITMTPNRKWSLGAKLTLFGAPLLLLVFLSTAATLWVSWQLDGGAAAVNEAGRMRMQAYRISLSVGLGLAGTVLQEQIREFDQSMAVLQKGDPERPLFVPWDDSVRAQYDAVARGWADYRARWLEVRHGALAELRPDTATFVHGIDALVAGLAAHPQVAILSDEIYGQMTYDGLAHQTLLVVGVPEALLKEVGLDLPAPVAEIEPAGLSHVPDRHHPAREAVRGHGRNTNLPRVCRFSSSV